MLACKHTTVALEYVLLSFPRDRPSLCFHHPPLFRPSLLFRPPKSFPTDFNRTTPPSSRHSMESASPSATCPSQNFDLQSTSFAVDHGKINSNESAFLGDTSHEWNSRGDSYEEQKQVPVSGVFQQTELDEFSASVKVDAPFLRFVIGKGGKTKQKIEKETTTKIYVPAPRKVKHGSCIGIKGPSQEKVDEAVLRIQTLLHEAEESSSVAYSHFISLPLAFHPALREQVMKFHDSVLSLKTGNNGHESVECSDSCRNMINIDNEMEVDVSVTGVSKDFIDSKKVRGLETVSIAEGREENSVVSDAEEEAPMVNDEGNSPDKQEDHGIDESIFIKPTRLHLTVLMLKLWNTQRVATAIDVLQSLQSKLLEILDNRPLAVRLRGLECMKGSMEKAHVLYASIEENDERNRLIEACNIMRDAFADAGLVSKKEQNHELKLHATIINTLHRKRKKGRKFGKRIPINAREIILKHGSDDWGEHLLAEAHLSQRFAYGEDDYYRCCSAIQFPVANVVDSL